MEYSLKNKRILFFSPEFFGYENKISEKMKEMGAKVDLFDERSVSKSYEKALLKINPNIYNRKTEKYYFNILNQIKSNHYDYVIFVKCDMPTIKVLKEYKRIFSKAKICLYMWDSIANIPNINKKLYLFDYISSFDRQDCEKNKNINFRALFYCDDYKFNSNERTQYKYDISFIGTIHSDRYKILKEIEKYAKEKNLCTYIYPFLQSKFIYYFYKLIKKEFRDTTINDFKFDYITSNEIAKIVEQSRIIIDIQHPNQTGLTMRTIEMIGMKKKIITTNKDIVNYDFYDSRNIYVLDRNNPSIELTSLQGDFHENNTLIYEKYSLRQWIKELLGDEK